MKKFRISLYKEPQGLLSTEELDNLRGKVAETQYEITEENIEELVGEGMAKNGYAFCPATFKDNEYGINSFEQTQLLVLSFPYSEVSNKPQKVSFDSIMDRIKKYRFQPIFAWKMFYKDFFGDGKYGNFLIGFLMDTPFYDYRSAEAAQRALLMMFPEAKEYPCNSIQIYQGGCISIGLLKSMPTLNIEFLFMQMCLYLKDKYGATNYKRKLKEFSKQTGVALNARSFPSLSRLSSRRERLIDENNKILPETIMYNNNSVDGKILSNSSPKCRIKFINDSDTSSNNDTTGTKRTSYRSQYLNVLNDICPLYHDFISGKPPTFKAELGLASNLCRIESGARTFKDVLQKQMKAKQRSVDVWSFYFDYLKDHDPQPCASFCPHADICKHGTTMLSTLKPALHQMERIFNDEQSLVTLNEAEKDFSRKFDEALNSSKRGWHVLKSQTALGKTQSILKVLEDLYMTVLVAVPTNMLKREVYDRAEDSNNSIGVSPSLHEIEDELSENLWDKIESLYSRGKSPWPLISKMLLETERAEKADHNAQGKAPKKQNSDIEVLRKYQGELLAFKKSHSVITTHKRMTTMDLSKFDVVIVDEDIIFTNVIPSRETVPISALKRLKKKLPPPDPLAIKIKDILDKRKKKDYFYLNTIKFDDDYDEIKLEVNIRALCAAEYFYYQRADDIDSAVSVDSIIFVNPVTFGRPKKNKSGAKESAKETKFIMLSATANKTICEHVFGKDNVTFYECAEAEITGKLNLYPERPMSRSYIKDHIEVMEQIKKFTGVKHTITFKKFSEYCSTEMHFGNCSGSDILKGKDIDVIGTPHQPEWIYKLFAYSLNHDIDCELKPHTLVTHNGFRFRFTTYDDEFLRTIQFYIIESDLEQAVGRARLLRCDCTVNLFSNFPLRQATLMEADLDSD